jgi:hypothetical protein
VTTETHFTESGNSPPKLNRRAFGFTSADVEGLAALNDPATVARFWSKTQPASDDPDACLLWTARCNWGGYPRFSLHHGREVQAHRFAYALANGSIPDGLELDHLCRNVTCVRADHLEAVVPRTNILRGTGFAAKNAMKTHCPSGHPLTPERHAGQRVCLFCRRLPARLRAARRRADPDFRARRRAYRRNYRAAKRQAALAQVAA